ncbi:hypothetical protein L1987_21456 [Smallanthus sonchifolius]|uniref:Uncharacterized protein n=1 Tax=Smallanthus sonchifolius TaxID=185202 RepID=A0ACB9IV54_9ASTR|nr:hypothetical protein L1987_21456 [Smallanthus sonchifolius]
MNGVNSATYASSISAQDSVPFFLSLISVYNVASFQWGVNAAIVPPRFRFPPGPPRFRIPPRIPRRRPTYPPPPPRYKNPIYPPPRPTNTTHDQTVQEFGENLANKYFGNKFIKGFRWGYKQGKRIHSVARNKETCLQSYESDKYPPEATCILDQPNTLGSKCTT